METTLVTGGLYRISLYHPPKHDMHIYKPFFQVNFNTLVLILPLIPCCSFLSLSGFKSRKRAPSKIGFALVWHYQKYNSFCINSCVLAITVMNILLLMTGLLRTYYLLGAVLYLYYFIKFSQ